MEVVWVDQQIHEVATAAALAGSGRGTPSLVDCVSFEVIRLCSVDTVFAFDKHFRARGCRLLLDR
jgi:predicted nucleic acid-binding protein